MEDAKKKLVNWVFKIRFLKGQIDKLEKLKDAPIIAIAAFLLKSQIIEFELRQLIFSLDLHLHSQNKSKLTARKVRTPKDLSQLTLRKLVEEIKEFEGPKLRHLEVKLQPLVNKRDHFTHHLFSSSKDIKVLTKDAEEGLKIANETLKILEKLEKIIKTYDEK